MLLGTLISARSVENATWNVEECSSGLCFERLVPLLGDVVVSASAFFGVSDRHQEYGIVMPLIGCSVGLVVVVRVRTQAKWEDVLLADDWKTVDLAMIKKKMNEDTRFLNDKMAIAKAILQ